MSKDTKQVRCFKNCGRYFSSLYNELHLLRDPKSIPAVLVDAGRQFYSSCHQIIIHSNCCHVITAWGIIRALFNFIPLEKLVFLRSLFKAFILTSFLLKKGSLFLMSFILLLDVSLIHSDTETKLLKVKAIVWLVILFSRLQLGSSLLILLDNYRSDDIGHVL